MSSFILRTTMRFLLPLLLLYSVFLFLRGHNHSGGGFIGGLVAGSGFILYALGCQVSELKQLIKVEPRNLMVWGLTLTFLSALAPLFWGDNFLKGEWYALQMPRFGEIWIGTPLFFELGVYLVVIGTTLTILMNLMEE